MNGIPGEPPKWELEVQDDGTEPSVNADLLECISPRMYAVPHLRQRHQAQRSLYRYRIALKPKRHRTNAVAII
ncbi:hypothetical protein FRC08_002923 [Ceratobasidium sp. 394]|nr:hypothetical protein FRC08_002923 [Ceratobasidium sp. 394]